MAVFVLAPGAWHGAWCFEKIVPLLEGRGHKVLTPDLKGTGADHTPLEQVSFEGWARDIAALCAAQGEPVILLGHSRGGIVISQAAEYAKPGAIRLLVYLTAGLARDGETMVEAAYGGAAPGLQAPAEPAISEPSPGEMGIPVFYHLVPPEDAARAVARLRPEPSFSRHTRVRLSDERYGRIPRAYIECLEDRAIPIEGQRRMQAASPCVRVISIASDHSPFYSAPEELAQALDSLA